MLNGAVTLGTEDGANVKSISWLVMKYIYFRKSSSEVIGLYESEVTIQGYYSDPEIERLVDFAISKDNDTNQEPHEFMPSVQDLFPKTGL